MTLYTIENLKTYPQDGNHQKVVWNIFMPFNIVKGSDGLPPDNGNYKRGVKKHWWVMPKTHRDSVGYIHDISIFMDLPDVKEFKTVEKAVEFCLKWKEKWLKQQIDELQNYTRQK